MMPDSPQIPKQKNDLTLGNDRESAEKIVAPSPGMAFPAVKQQEKNK